MDARAKSSRWPRGSPWVFDGLLALGLAGLSVQLVSTSDGPVGAPAYALALLHTLPLAARRRFPGAVLALSVASGLAVAALGLPPEILVMVILVAVYSVAAYGDRWVPLAGRAVAEERLRLARELHDVVAHAMSVIAFQSGVGAHVANTQPQEAGKARA